MVDACLINVRMSRATVAGVQGAVQGSAGCGCQGGVQPRSGSTGPLCPRDRHAAGDEGPQRCAVHGRQRTGGPHPAAHAVLAAWQPLGCPAEGQGRKIWLVSSVSISLSLATSLDILAVIHLMSDQCFKSYMTCVRDNTLWYWHNKMPQQQHTGDVHLSQQL